MLKEDRFKHSKLHLKIYLLYVHDLYWVILNLLISFVWYLKIIYKNMKQVPYHFRVFYSQIFIDTSNPLFFFYSLRLIWSMFIVSTFHWAIIWKKIEIFTFYYSHSTTGVEHAVIITYEYEGWLGSFGSLYGTHRVGGAGMFSSCIATCYNQKDLMGSFTSTPSCHLSFLWVSIKSDFESVGRIGLWIYVFLFFWITCYLVKEYQTGVSFTPDRPLFKMA